MIKFLLNRPLVVFLCTVILILLGLYSFTRIPISLLPNIEIPGIIVKFNYPNSSAKVIEQNITAKLREDLVSLDKLETIDCQSTDNAAILKLNFDYSAKMDLLYIEVNERIDRISNNLPKDLTRPQVIKLNTSDVPIIKIQVVPKHKEDYIQVSDLTQKVIKKRLEQIEGISFVDINGIRTGMVAIQPMQSALNAAGLTEEDLISSIKNANSELGSLSIRDGQYRYYIKVSNTLENIDQIAGVPIRFKNGIVSTIGNFAKVTTDIQEPEGYHLYKGREGLVVTVQKQSQSKMDVLVPKIIAVVNELKDIYPAIDFSTTQDQTYLLNQGISNLVQDLWYGGFFCFFLLLLFLGNIASPILMSVSIPLSLLLTFILFDLFNISFNIISLSGLALGIGMLIDNSIVVLDSITRKRREGFDMDQSCIIGVADVISPVVSNVLTTIAIYIPLIYLSGMAGALIFDQAIALTISLGVSLLVSFCLNPVMYKYLLKTDPAKLKQDTFFFKKILSSYHQMVSYIFKRKKIFFFSTIILMPLGFLLFRLVPVAALPKISENESVISIDWNEPLDTKENLRRIEDLSSFLDRNVIEWDADVGIQQFVLRQEYNTSQTSLIYYKTVNENVKATFDKLIARHIKQIYPSAQLKVSSAPNAFTQLFQDDQSFLEARFRPMNNVDDNDYQTNLKNMLNILPNKTYELGLGFVQEGDVELTIDYNKLSLYDIDQNQFESKLNQVFGNFTISSIRRFGEYKPIRFNKENTSLAVKLQALINSRNGQFYPINQFISTNAGQDNKFITSDKSGIYESIHYSKTVKNDIKQLQKEITSGAIETNLSVSFFGDYFSNKSLLKEMTFIFIISLLLLYFILAIQFENLIHPFIVMLTIPIGISGGIFVLWAAGGTLDVMSAIGFVFVLGIIVDDPSLKVETINRLRKEYANNGMTNKEEVLLKALHDAGEICLKPLLMVSLTTSLALIPVLFSGGIGNDLQRPFVYVIIGGISLGTFFTLWFIPLAYWFFTKKV
ncbi:efflux RND transporter permease subunit [Mucilaginibacter sp. BJC16-A38]|uniref:efflux RND transporter permease subunit n=1 Tax=Mucilaginibacter phenanthrenivorans TaxID=1234842 RepID=UPI0021584E21|nr:efflux RND transporter permease subunit [Mucilaginibacter phenanthrenivorans]MCR8561067.1 efflux RND transporter permease subunit [Mucilaginibacter phenanthrenivorans]